MNKTLITAATLLLLGAPLAFAANTTTYAPNAKPATMAQVHKLAASTPSAQCTALEQQFSKEEATHKTMKGFSDAAKLRDDGKNLCTANKAPEGVKKLEQALKLIGVKPTVKS